jgi:hypothetical protein
MVLWLWRSATAPIQQRNEARDYARALEAHARDYAQWARRREIAEDFRRETFEHAHQIIEGYDRRSAAELDQHWRATVANVAGQLREHGARDDAQTLIEIRSNLAALDAKEDGYGDDERARIRNSMLTLCQNVWSATRSHDAAPTVPAPPKAASDQ